jgi:hypothetical protein
MDNLSIALRWAQLGIRVFPCHAQDGWAKGKEVSMKAPIPTHGFKEATTKEDAIRTWWSANPADLVGLHTGNELVVLDIDVSAEKNKDGWHSLNEKGIEPPKTFNVTTKNGGNHYFYRNQSKIALGPTVGVKLPSGEIIEDVDRRAGGSYVIAWSNNVPASLEELSPAPEWLCTKAGLAIENPYTGTITEWFSTLENSAASPLVVYAKKKLPQSNINHQQMLNVTANLVRLGASGETGVEQALAEFKETYLKPPYNTSAYEQAFEKALLGAINKFGGKPMQSPEVNIDHLIAEKVIELEVRKEAERIVASKNYQGSKVLTWDDLAEAEQQEIVENLVPYQGVAILVGDSNIGKTFAYIDMACRVVAGMEWLGKKTKPVKVLIILGEGKSGFLSRIQSWCEYHDYDIDLLKPWFQFIGGGNLNSDQSLELIRSEAINQNCQLVIYDTWAAISGVYNENDAGLTSETVTRVLIALPDRSHLFIHHPTKASGKSTAPIPRGSGALPAAADVVMTLFKDKDGKKKFGSDYEWVSISTETTHNGKNRNSSTETIRGLRLKKMQTNKVVFHHEDGLTSKKPVANIKKYLTTPMTAGEYAGATGLSESQARREISSGLETGLVEEISPSRGNIGAKYRLATEGNPKPSAPEIDWQELVNKSTKQKKVI